MTASKAKALVEVLKEQGITNTRVLEAISRVPREKFVPESELFSAYDNTALPIDCQQTISQPYIVASMTELLLGPDDPHKIKKVLEIGTGSGYQTAVLCQVAQEVYTIERIEQLYTQAKKLLTQLNYKNIHFRYGDGNLGWEEAAPFDGIIVTAGIDQIPPALLEQLSKKKGRLIIPLGESDNQNLTVITRKDDDYHEKTIERVRFVPLKPGLE